MHTETFKPWYLEPQALAIIAGISSRPETRSSRDVLARAGVERQVYAGPDLASLQRYWTQRFKEVDAIKPWPEAMMTAVLMCADEQDVIAAMFGDASGYRTVPEIAAKRAAIREQIEAALAARKIAA